jgi:hypothetical protein
VQVCSKCGQLIKKIEYHPTVLAEPRGVGGWLAVFCFAVCVAAPLTFMKAYVCPHPHLGWSMFLSGIPAACGVLAGWLIFVENSKAILFVQIFFALLLLKSFVWLSLWVISGFRDEDYLRIAIQTVVPVIVWFTYFQRSVRVANTFGGF